MVSFIALLLVYKLLTQNIEPLTTILALFQMILHYNFKILPSGALIPFYVIEYKEYYRLISSIFLHADQIHLYFNIISLITRGNSLEKIIGINHYAKIIIYLGLLSNIIYVLFTYILKIMNYQNLYYTPVVGFSAVLFGIKYIYDNNFLPEYQVIFGQTIMTKYVIYVELLLVSIIHPRVSFLGHLCGIISAQILNKFSLL